MPTGITKDIERTNQAVVYCRVATKSAEGHEALDQQEQLCRGYCKERGWRVARVFSERASGKGVEHRPQLQEMLDYCAGSAAKTAHVVVYDMARLSRSAGDFSALLLQLHSAGIDVQTAVDMPEEPKDVSLTDRVLASVAQFENDIRSQRVKDGIRAARLRREQAATMEPA